MTGSVVFCPVILLLVWIFTETGSLFALTLLHQYFQCLGAAGDYQPKIIRRRPITLSYSSSTLVLFRCWILHRFWSDHDLKSEIRIYVCVPHIWRRYIRTAIWHVRALFHNWWNRWSSTQNRIEWWYVCTIMFLCNIRILEKSNEHIPTKNMFVQLHTYVFNSQILRVETHHHTL